jgi:RHS repeat-associated protein
MPVTITEGANSSHFVYGPEHQRTLQTRGDGSTIVYAGAMETDIASGGAVTQKTYWPMGLGVEIDAPNAATALYWTHTDKLGSVIATTDQNGNQQDMSYDAWGARRNLNGVGAPANLSPPDDKGYTGQEMLDQLALVHMNGRVYDPLTGRFLSADSILQDPTSSQSYNRYSYVWNNPTNATDPSGYLSLFGIHILPGLFNNGNIKIGAAVVVAVFAPYISAYVGWTGAVVDGVATAGGVSGSLGLSGAVGSGILGGAAAGGIMGGTLQSAVVGGFTGGAFGAVGDAWKVPGSMGNVLGHAAVGCASGLMSGTGCGTGALSAGFSAAAAPYVSVLGPVGGTVASAVVGGTASVLGGGTFESGAVMGAEGYLFNQLAGHGMSFPGSETINIGDVNAQAVMNSPDVAIGQAINQATWVAPGSPDFVTFSADIYIASLSVTYTRFGDIYTGDGVSRAYPSPLSIGFSVSGGYMLSCAQTSQDVLNQFISGWSASGGYYRGVGGSVSANLSGAAVNIGLGFGGGGISPGAVNKPRGNIGGKP